MRTVGLTLAGLLALGLTAGTAQAGDGPKHPAQITVAAQFGTVGLGTIHEVNHSGWDGYPGHGYHGHGYHGHGYHGPIHHSHHDYPHYVPRYYGPRYYGPYPVYPPVPTYRYRYYLPYRGFYYSGPHVSFGIDF